ncbi:hypothetical protein [Agrobacterium vitis]|uniref:hypothetical protein n=1 Tax=Agrobacterium vitis TaxID=373 RepID=UPI001F3B8D4D|nr:hypothetical protein [Agrobacterium vitis]
MTEENFTESGAELGFTLKDFYEKNGVSPGADLFVIGNGSIDRCGQHALLLTSLGNEDGPLVKEVVIILPPGYIEETARAGIEEAYRKAIVDHFPEAGARSSEIRLPKRVTFSAMTTFSTDDVIHFIESARHPAAFVLPWAARYRKPLELAAKVDYPEDAWAPELHSLGTAIVETVHSRGSYVALDAGEWWPEREENCELLLDIQHCGIANASNPDRSLVELTATRQRWADFARNGEVDRALEQIAAKAGISHTDRVFNRMVVFNEAGLRIETTAEFTREKEFLDAEVGEGALLFVGPAIDAGLTEQARDLLCRACPMLNRVETIQTALRFADALDDESLTTLVEAILIERHPRSQVLVERTARRLVAEGRQIEAVRILRGSGDAAAAREASFLTWIESQLAVKPLDAALVLSECCAAFPDFLPRAMRVIASKLEQLDRRVEAIGLLIAGDGPDGFVGRPELWRAMAMLEQGILKLDSTCDGDVSAIIIEKAIRWLSRNPLDGHVRLKVADLLSPQMIGGTRSTAVIASVVLRLAGRKLELRASTPVSERSRACDVALLPSILRIGLSHFEQQPGAVLGRARFPADKLEIPADEAVAAFVDLIEHAGETFGEKQDARAIENYLLVATSIAAVGTQPDADLMLLCTAGGKLALHGQGQRARDLAEHALNIAGKDPHRIRVAWYTFADLYQRSGNVIEAMIGYAAALAADDEVDGDQLWYESYLGIRLFRDAGLFQFLPAMLDRARAALAMAGLAESRGHWLETIELQLRLARLDRNAITVGELTELLERSASNLRDVLDANDDVGPATMLLASIARLARDFAVPMAVDAAVAIEDGKMRLGNIARSLLALTTDPTPTKEDVIGLATAIDSARYADDVGFDMRHLAIGARRLLEVSAGDPETAALAIEMMSELGIPSPSSGRVADLPKDAAAPAMQAREIVAEGLDVVMLGLADNGLTRLVFSRNEETVVLEEEMTFSAAALREWRKHYPYAYEDSKRDTSHDFFVSTVNLGLSNIPERAVIIAGTDLQALPPNILQVGRELAGREHRLALSPSLSWLCDARNTQFKGDGVIRAWIPDAEPEEGLPALAVLSDRLRPSFETHSVELFNEEAMRATLSGSDMVIIGAHGGVGQDKRYFRVVTDDVDLALASSAFSSELRDVGVVVLFVCSGGRIDKHPGASMTIGLAKQLLASGCRAVVAPPWPLDVSVPPIWLPIFLDGWMSGAAVLDACFQANGAVQLKRGDIPAASLAMTVYGDPLFSRPGL